MTINIKSMIHIQPLPNGSFIIRQELPVRGAGQKPVIEAVAAFTNTHDMLDAVISAFSKKAEPEITAEPTPDLIGDPDGFSMAEAARDTSMSEMITKPGEDGDIYGDD